LIPELVGRLPVLTALQELDCEALTRILREPKNALIKQYEKLMELEHVELEFTPEAVEAIAKAAIERKTGARGLRAIMEEVMLDIMYDVPEKKDVKRVVVSADTVQKKAAPRYVLAKKEKEAAAQKQDVSAS
jgi:ATP-dependent Clp protease ATP-binding subunit ClpX